MSHIQNQLFSVIIFDDPPQFRKRLKDVELVFFGTLAENLSKRASSLLVVVDSDQGIKLPLKAKLLDNRKESDALRQGGDVIMHVQVLSQLVHQLSIKVILNREVVLSVPLFQVILVVLRCEICHILRRFSKHLARSIELIEHCSGSLEFLLASRSHSLKRVPWPQVNKVFSGHRLRHSGPERLW